MFPYDNYALHLLPLKQASRASTPVPAALREAQLFEEFTDAAVAVTASGKPPGLELGDAARAVEPGVVGLLVKGLVIRLVQAETRCRR